MAAHAGASAGLGTNAQWRAMCDALNRPDLASDTRFASLDGRITNGDLKTLRTDGVIS